MNVRIEARMESHSMRISAVERRVMWLAGVAAAGGAVVGQAVSAFIM